MKRVAVIGGGISGLAAAYTLLRSRPEWNVEIFEASHRIGGLIETEKVGPYCLDFGPDSMICDSDATWNWIEKLDLHARVIRTRDEHPGAYILSRGKLRRIPAGVSVLGTSRIDLLWRSDLLSKRGKLRVALEPFIKRRKVEDESIGEFVERRYGRQFLERIAAPMVRGIYGSDAHSLSLQANLPRFAELEKKHGSVTQGLKQKEQDDPKEAGQGARYGAFISFVEGMAELPNAFLKVLSGKIRFNKKVSKIEKQGENWIVFSGNEMDKVDALLVAISAPQSAKLLQPIDAALGALLGSAQSAPAAIATFAWPKQEVQQPLDAFGFVVAPSEPGPIAACTWTSAKWPARAPENELLARVFVDDSLLRDATLDDKTLLREVERELRSIMGIKVASTLRQLRRWDQAMPRYRVGHLQWLEEIRAGLAEHPTLALAGNSYHGVGIPAALNAGRLAAEEIVVALASRISET